MAREKERGPGADGRPPPLCARHCPDRRRCASVTAEMTAAQASRAPECAAPLPYGSSARRERRRRREPRKMAAGALQISCGAPVP